jgi:hypothetical protein
LSTPAVKIEPRSQLNISAEVDPADASPAAASTNLSTPRRADRKSVERSGTSPMRTAGIEINSSLPFSKTARQTGHFKIFAQV